MFDHSFPRERNEVNFLPLMFRIIDSDKVQYLLIKLISITIDNDKLYGFSPSSAKYFFLFHSALNQKNLLNRGNMND